MTENNTPLDPSSNLPAPMPQGYGPGALMTRGRIPAPPTFSEPEGIPWAHYFDALRRNWWIVVAVTALGSAVGLYLARQAIPVYQADATIWIARTRNAQQDRGPIRAQELLGSSSWDELMRSYAIVEPVVRRLSLNVRFNNAADSPLARRFSLDSTFQPGYYRLEVDTLGRSYTLSTQARGIIERGTVGDSIGREFGFVWAPDAALLTPGRVVEFSVATVRATAGNLQTRLYTRIPGEDGQFMLLTLTGDDAQRTAATLNAWAGELVSIATDMKKFNRVELRGIMSQQLATVERQLAIAAAELQRFRERTATLLPDNPEATGNAAFFQLQASRDAAQGDRAALERIRNESRDGSFTPQAFLAVPGILNSSPPLNAAIQELVAAQSDLQSKKRVFTDSSRQVIDARARVDAIARQTIPGIMDEIIASLKSQESGLTTRIDSLSRELRAVPARTLEEQRLRRNYAQSEALYNQLKAAFEQAQLADAQTTPDLKIFVEAETPLRPSSDQGPRLLFLAVMSSVAAGLGLALLRDRFDRRFRHPEQATMELGLAIVGTVPKFGTNRHGDLSVAAMSQVVESFRSLRLSVRHHFALDQPVVLCVSSPGVGEGKSLVSSNLAIAFANAGHKTLLIDGDVRRGVVHTAFDLQRRPGLVDLLAGSVERAAAIVHATSTENLSVITSGARSRKAPELLVSDQLTTLVAEMRRQFEVVVIDSAPFAAGMDAYALGAAAGAMLVVLRPGVTDRKLAAAKLELLDRLPVAVVGAVLNAISGSGAYRYYYSDYVDYSVDEVDDDQKDEKESLKPRLIGPT